MSKALFVMTPKMIEQVRRLSSHMLFVFVSFSHTKAMISLIMIFLGVTNSHGTTNAVISDREFTTRVQRRQRNRETMQLLLKPHLQIIMLLHFLYRHNIFNKTHFTECVYILKY